MGSSSLEPVYFFQIVYSASFRDCITSDITSDTLAIVGSASSDKCHVFIYFAAIKKDNLHELVSTDYYLEYFPCHQELQ